MPPPAGDLVQARFDATQQWLRQAPVDYYSIQLLTANTQGLSAMEKLLERAATNNRDLSAYHVYGVKIDGRQHYRLAYGSYATRADANRAIRDLPAVYRKAGPYLRSIERMRSQNRR